jgi:methionine aminotransferase
MDQIVPGGISIFATMSQLCREYNAINLAQGCPDFDCDPELISLVQKHMKAGLNQYAPMEGIPGLRQAISKKTFALYNAEYDPAGEVTVTCGATEAVYCAITCILGKGDETILFEPAFDSYAPLVERAGGIVVPVPLTYPEYRIDWELTASKISDRTRLIIINSPHNPTGSTLSEEDLNALERICDGRNIYILSDEVYEHIIFDGQRHLSLALSTELRKRTFIIASFGKTFHTTGWRLGYCIAPAALSAMFRKLHQFVTFSAVTPIQYAVAEYLEDESHYLDLGNFYAEKRNYFLNLMQESEFRFIPSKGTYFQLMSYDGISELNDMQFSEWMVKTLQVASIPLSPLYSAGSDKKIIRFCFAKKAATLKEAAERLCSI